MDFPLPFLGVPSLEPHCVTGPGVPGIRQGGGGGGVKRLFVLLGSEPNGCSCPSVEVNTWPKALRNGDFAAVCDLGLCSCLPCWVDVSLGRYV